MRPSLRQVLFRSAAGLDLNFAGGVFSLNNTRTASPAAIPGWTFSRTDTNGTATALDLAGNVIQFATGVPRITNRGILVEEARTNLLLNSASLGTTWTQTNVTIGSDVAIAPDGTLTADSLIENAAAAVAHRISQAVTTTATATTTSVFLKAGSRSWAYVRMSNSVPANCFAWVNLATGALGTVSGTGATASVQALANGWYRLALTVATAVAGTNTIVIAGSTGDNVQDYDGTNGLTSIFAWGAQVEVGAFATSPIITTGAAGTRGVDLPSQPFDLPAAYTIMSDAEVTVAQAGRFPTVVSTSGANNGLFLNGTNTPGFNLSNGTYNAFLASPVTTGTIVRHAARAETDNVRGAINGTLTTLGTSFTPITGSRIVYIGSNVEVSARFNGYIRRIRVLPYAATDAQLQALTAP